MDNCLEVARNNRLCAGAEEYEKRIFKLKAKLKEAEQTLRANQIPTPSQLRKAVETLETL